MPAPGWDSIDARAAVDLVMRMMAIPGKSGEEGRIADFVVGELKRAGVPDSAISFDQAHKKSPIGGEIGNLIVRLPGTQRAPRRLLMGHIDTVPLCVGAQPVRNAEWIKSRDPGTALGGDNRGGSAVVLNAAITLLREKLPHPPLTLYFPIQEEVGLIGARFVSPAALGRPKLCFNWDGGAPNGVVLGATGADHLDITVHGLASHAGAHPEDGISAVAIAGRAIADLTDNGWHGLVVKGRSRGTSNVGYIGGGEATNVVTNRVELRAEVRSHDPRFRAKIVKAYQQAFTRAARAVVNAAGRRGSVEITVQDKYESFRLEEAEPCVQAALAAVLDAGLEPETRVINGGLDANWLTAHGLPTVTLGCGQAGIHTVEERLHVESFLSACRIGLMLATGLEGTG
jgi:tripeptide aminopeptidase